MPRTDAELMEKFIQLRELAFSKLASPLRDAVIASHEARSDMSKTASSDKAISLHLAVP